MNRPLLVVAALSGALAVILGAFGAHALDGVLDSRGRELWTTASQYHFVHTLALLAVALLPAAGGSSRIAAIAGGAWLCGIVIFSGSLYLLAVTDAGWLGAVTPIGGVAFIGGWIALAFSARP